MIFYKLEQCIIISLFLIWIPALPCSSMEKNTLVLVDNFLIKETHSLFFKSLRARGHSLVFKSVEDATLSVFRYGELLYRNLIIFAPKVEEFGGKINKKTILDFIDEGGNVMIAMDGKPGVVLREIAAECGVEVDTPNSFSVGNLVIDHFNYQKTDPSHTLLTLDSSNLINAAVIVGPKISSPLLYRGIGLLVNNSNPLVLKVLSAHSTSYSASPNGNLDNAPAVAGVETTLIAAVQTRNNARILFSGSIDFFSDDAFLSKVHKTDGTNFERSSNAILNEHVSKWLLKETGVIRVKSVSHHRQGELEAPTDYTITEMAVYEMQLEYLSENVWKAFNVKDLQMEFVRIDPFIRTFVPLVGEGQYKVIFKIPDVYGVFKFLVDYKRVGYTSIFSSTQVSVRPLKHTQYERFISSAYPYYFSAFSMMVGVFLFSFVFLSNVDKDKTD